MKPSDLSSEWSQSNFWQEDSPAKTSARRGRESESSASAQVSGKNLLDWSQSYGLPVSWLKTFLPFGVEGLRWSYKISGRSGMTRNGIAFPLVPLALLTREIESGSLPTLRACSGKRSSGANRSELYAEFQKLPTLRATDGDRGGRGDLIQAIRGNENQHLRMPTLTVRDAEIVGGASDPEKRREQGHSVGLHDVVYYEEKLRLPTLTASDSTAGPLRRNSYGKHRGGNIRGAMLPTLTARDWKSGSASPETMERNSRPLSEVIRNLPTLTASRWSGLQSHGENAMLGPLNPEWCEWYMGYPIGWTDCGDSETP